MVILLFYKAEAEPLKNHRCLCHPNLKGQVLISQEIKQALTGQRKLAPDYW